MTHLLLTGFTPFDGRTVNGSWIAAQTYAAATHLEIPVVWGEPMPRLREAIETHQPEVIVSLGEGRDGWFDIETRARNERNHRADNNFQYPQGVIQADGPDAYRTSADVTALHRSIEDQNIPIRLSADAGQFLCEETLYCLEHLKSEYECIQRVLFVHLPPYGTELLYRGEHREVDGPLLQDFVQRLLSSFLNPERERAIEQDVVIASHQTENRG